MLLVIQLLTCEWIRVRTDNATCIPNVKINTYVENSTYFNIEPSLVSASIVGVLCYCKKYVTRVYWALVGVSTLSSLVAPGVASTQPVVPPAAAESLWQRYCLQWIWLKHVAEAEALSFWWRFRHWRFSLWNSPVRPAVRVGVRMTASASRRKNSELLMRSHILILKQLLNSFVNFISLFHFKYFSYRYYTDLWVFRV